MQTIENYCSGNLVIDDTGTIGTNKAESFHVHPQYELMICTKPLKLWSNFLQVSCHAFSGGSPAMWNAVSPEWLLFSTNYDTLTRRLLPAWQGGIYTALLTHPGIKGFYASDGAVKRIPLPLENRHQIRKHHIMSQTQPVYGYVDFNFP